MGYSGYFRGAVAQVFDITGTSISGGSGSPTAVGTANSDKQIVAIFNDCDNPLVLLRNGEDFLHLHKNDQIVLDLIPSGLGISNGDVFTVYNSGSAPTTGSLRVHLFGGN